jgi:hypothetical protein
MNNNNSKLSRKMQERAAMREQFETVGAPCCTFFGCGKQLTPTEFLFNDKFCFAHARAQVLNENNSPDFLDKKIPDNE